jgi:oligopeptide/dipeptide ABC transporter ATP-binding protein
MSSVPRLDATEHVRLFTIEGQPPLLLYDIPGCPFEPRCVWAIDKCATDDPPLEEKESGHMAKCWRNPRVDEPTQTVNADVVAAAAQT